MKPKSLLNSFYDGDNRLRFFDQRYLPRWIVLLIDLFICAFSAVAAWFILLGLPIVFYDIIPLHWQFAVVLVLNALIFYLVKSYAGIIRHSTFTDVLKLALAQFTVGFILIFSSYLHHWTTGEKVFLTTAVVLYSLTSFTLMLLFRMAVKESYSFLKNASNDSVKRVAIVGVDDQSITVGKALTSETDINFKLVGFISQKPSSKQLMIHGKPVISVRDSLTVTLNRLQLDSVVLVGATLSGVEKNRIVEDCLNAKIEVLNVPALEMWNSKEDIKNQLKPIQIEDLLEREPISIDDQRIRQDIKGKTILVTGGAGSIGSELVKQLAHFEPKLVVVLDQSEYNLHLLENQLKLTQPDLNFIIELANVSNMYRMGLMFEKYDFDLIYHAAAYKHVPLIERNPHEAIYVNVLGTVNVAILAVNYEIDKFVLVSTDKAVNPTSVMGASKRLAEMYVQSMQAQRHIVTRFITTRFGNVLDSSGSVIPFFRQQIEQGGPVTVTHKDIIRYFMTIPEACQLVLQAGTMGEGGEVYVFDMGEPVKILHLAEKMIRLSGLEPYRDIEITFTGLRPGEKLYEELLNDDASTLPTHHSKIMIGKVPPVEFEIIKQNVKEVVKAATRKQDHDVVQILKKIIPEFKSQNSVFERLDELQKTEIKS